MTLPLGKLTLLVGAGILGSAFLKEGRVSSVSDFLSGAFKIVKNRIQKDDSTSNVKPKNNTLLEEVKNLRKEMELVGSDRSVVIVNSGRSGAGTYGVAVVIVIVVGYGYIRWKGWKLSDMMFATRRGLSEARTSVAKQIDQFSSSISQTKRFLSSRIDRVDIRLDECGEITAATKEEISEVRDDVKTIGEDVESVHRAVQILETRIMQISGKQDLSNEGVRKLCFFVSELERKRMPEHIQASPSSSSRPALELPPKTLTSRTGSLPPKLSLEPPSPSASDESPKVAQSPQSAVSAAGLKELQSMAKASIEASTSSQVNNGVQDSEDVNNNRSSSSSRTGWRIPGLGGSILTRTRSANYSFK